jgi:hypothetical protein
MVTAYTYVTTGYDTPHTSGKVLTEKDYDTFKDSTRNARAAKILSHLFIEDEWSLWTDGTIELLKSPEEILAKYKDRGDIVTFKHRARDCAYDEAEAIFLGKREDNHQVVDEQVALYKKDGYPEHNGLFETGVMLRHHTPEVIAFNNYWWSLNCRFSKRDQLGANYTAWKLGIKVGLFDGTVSSSEDFYIYPHPPR